MSLSSSVNDSGVANEEKHSFDECSFGTRAIHCGQEPEKWTSRAVVAPIVLSTTYKQFAPAEHAGFEYGRSGNPTRNTLEECLAPLEKAKHSLAFSSGLAATTTLSYLLESGQHILIVDDVYGGTNRFFRKCAGRMGIESTFVDMLDLNATAKAFKPNTKMVWIETPTNPTLKLIDIKAVTELAKKANPEIIVVVDNTFASPYFQNPLLLGADVVVHSLTKYMNGHSDAVMGAIMLNRDDIHEQLRFYQNSLGAVPSPFDSFLVNRGLKTLAVRMKQHQENGLAVAQSLTKNPRVTKVIYPGLPDHPQHKLYKTQMKGFGGMCSIYIKGGLKEATVFMQSLRIITLAESLGGYESLIEHPALMTHASIPAESRKLLGIDDNFCRLSIGLEEAEDLIADIEQALVKAIPTL